MKAFLFLFTLILLPSCTPSSLTLSKVHLTSQKGLTQTLTTKERLKPFESEQYILHQPHLKVVRVFEGKEDNKTVHTTYYPSGHIYQLLECKNNQAYGEYKEWSESGQIKVQANVRGGSPELERNGIDTWFFDGKCKAYDDEGNLLALFNYTNGSLEGESRLYYPSGQLHKLFPYQNDQLHGEVLCFDLEGECLEKRHYVKGFLDGLQVLYWKNGALASNEKFSEGLLKSGQYFNRLGKLVSQVKQGDGYRTRWCEGFSKEETQYQGGVPKGQIRKYNESGHLTHEYSQKEGLKEGLEVVYFPHTQQPKLRIEWSQGQVHGCSTTWYSNGNIESEREMSQNKKHGVLTARYQNGDLMLIEEYDQDLLVKGQYFKIGSSFPVSSVSAGQGSAHLFDSNGILLQKVDYSGGRPVE